MPIDIKKLLQTALQEIEREEHNEALEARFRELEERQITLADLVHALESASDEELQQLEGSLLASLVGSPEAPPADEPPADEPSTDEPPAAKPPRRTRPGRKSGMAYDWWVDDEGRVTKLDIARVYTGEDEPDEVELPDEEETEEKAS